jgi:hypothetical protein
MKKMAKKASPMKTMPKTNRASTKTGLGNMGKNPPGFEPGGPPKGAMRSPDKFGSKPESKKMLDKKTGERGSMKKTPVKKIRK